MEHYCQIDAIEAEIAAAELSKKISGEDAPRECVQEMIDWAQTRRLSDSAICDNLLLKALSKCGIILRGLGAEKIDCERRRVYGKENE